MTDLTDQEVTSGFLTTPDNVRLATDIAGEPFHTRILFVHGGQSRQAWRGTLGLMARAGYSVVSYDLRGHGQSDWAPDGNYSLNAHISDLTAIVNTSARPTVLIGAFLGGRVALGGAAMLGPDRISALVLIESAPYVSTVGFGRIRDFVNLSLAGYEDAASAQDSVARHFSHPVEIWETYADMPLEQGEDERFYWLWDPLLARLVNRDQDAIERRLTLACARLACPTLLVRSTRSDMVSDDSIAHFQRHCSDGRVVNIGLSPDRSNALVRLDYWKSVLEFLDPLLETDQNRRTSPE